MVDFLESVQLDPGLMIGLSGLLIAVIQVALGLRREKFERTFEMIRWLQEPEMLKSRNRSRDIMETARRLNYEFDKLSVEDRAALSGLANLFGLLGLLVRTNVIQRRLILEGWSRHIIATYDRLVPYFEWRKTLPGGDSLRRHFEWLAKRVRRFSGAKNERRS